MDSIEGLAADNFVGGVTGEPLDRFCRESNRALAIEQRERVRAVLDDRRVPRLPLPPFMPLGHIHHRSDEPTRPSSQTARNASRIQRIGIPAGNRWTRHLYHLKSQARAMPSVEVRNSGGNTT